MSNNIKAIQESIFAKFSNVVKLSDTERGKSSIFLSEDEFRQLENGVKIILSHKITSENIFAFATVEEKKYLLATGDFADFSLDACAEVDDNVPVFMLAISELNIPCIRNVSEELLLEKIFTGENNRLEWQDVACFFPRMCLYELKDPWIDGNDEDCEYYLRSLMVAVCCLNQQNLSLPFEKETINEYGNLLNRDDKHIPIDNILHSLLESEWKFCFLDVYRAIERLFYVSWIHKCQIEFGSTKPIVQINDSIRKLSVEHHEDKCMIHLFSCVNGEKIGTISSVVGDENVGKYIYRLRNEIVHFQKSDNRINNIDSKCWNLLIRFMVMSIIDLYALLNKYIDELPNM